MSYPPAHWHFGWGNVSTKDSSYCANPSLIDWGPLTDPKGSSRRTRQYQLQHVGLARGGASGQREYLEPAQSAWNGQLQADNRLVLIRREFAFDPPLPKPASGAREEQVRRACDLR